VNRKWSNGLCVKATKCGVLLTGEVDDQVTWFAAALQVWAKPTSHLEG
jgi:hypothetical protein